MLVPITKENGENIMKPISYQLLFINSTRFRESSLSNLVDNIAGEIYKAKYKYGHDDKKYETRGNNIHD